MKNVKSKSVEEIQNTIEISGDSAKTKSVAKKHKVDQSKKMSASNQLKRKNDNLEIIDQQLTKIEIKPQEAKEEPKEGAKIDEPHQSGVTPSITIKQNWDGPKIKLLLPTMEQVNSIGKNGESALMLASLKGQAEMVTLLLISGAKVDEVDRGGWTALILASYGGHVDVVRLLISAKAKINKANTDGGTALMLASLKGQTEVVKLLIKAGADINCVNKVGGTALMGASLYGHTEVIKQLLAEKVKVDEVNKSGDTALIIASRSGQTGAVKLLIEAGADLNKTNKNNSTALILASQEGHVDIVKLLLEAEAEPDKVNKNGGTALILASYEGHAEVVKLLLKAKTEANIDEKYGVAIIMANIQNHLTVFESLIAYQFKLNKQLTKCTSEADSFITEAMINVINHHNVYQLPSIAEHLEKLNKSGIEVELSKLSRSDKFILRKLVNQQLSEKQIESFAKEKPSLYDVGYKMLNLITPETLQVVNFVNKFTNQQQQAHLFYADLMLSILCLDKIVKYYTGDKYDCANMVKLSKTNILNKYYSMLVKHGEASKVVTDFAIKNLQLETMNWVLNKLVQLSLEEKLYTLCKYNQLKAVRE